MKEDKKHTKKEKNPYIEFVYSDNFLKKLDNLLGWFNDDFLKQDNDFSKQYDDLIVWCGAQPDDLVWIDNRELWYEDAERDRFTWLIDVRGHMYEILKYNLGLYIHEFYKIVIEKAKRTIKNFNEEDFIKSEPYKINESFQHFDNEYIFLDSVRQKFKEKIGRVVVKIKEKDEQIDNTLNNDQLLDEENKKNAIEWRNKYLYHLKQHYSSTKDPEFIDMKIFYPILEKLSLKEVLILHDELEANRIAMLEYYKEIESMSEGTKQTFIDYYSQQRFEHIVPFIHNYFSLRLTDDSIGAKLINKKISVNNPELLCWIKRLQGLNNILECKRLGLIDRNILFNGRKYINIGTMGGVISEVEEDTLISKLKSFDRGNQTALTYDEDKVEDLMKSRKSEICAIRKKNKAGKNTELTLLSEVYGVNKYFLKEKTFGDDGLDLAISLYYLPFGNIDYATQVYRIDKTPNNARGYLNCHKQISGEKIISNIHIHKYNRFDKAYNFQQDQLGSFDIDVNFDNTVDIDNEDLEMFFDQQCNIDKMCEYAIPARCK